MPHALLAVLVVVITCAAAGAGVYLVGRPQAPAEPPPPRQPRQSLAGIDALVPSAPPASPAPPPTTAAVIGGPGVTPTPPRVFAIAPASVPQETLHKISALKHVQKVAAVDAGAVKVSGAGLNLLAVDPAQFRSWTPKVVADQPAVWEALAKGEMVASGDSARRLGLVLGAAYQVDGGPRLRVAASATLGLPGVDGLVGPELGRRLGLLPGVAVLVHGPEERVAAMDAGVRKLLGKDAQVVTVGGGGGARSGVGDTAEKAPAAPQRVLVGRPTSYLELYRLSAAVCPGLSWTVLAAIGQVESSHGRNNGPSSAGALGPMQFMPATWKAYGVDGDGDGVADIWSPYDAVPSAANYLCATGANQGGEKLRKAVWHYNHSWSYVDKVLGIAAGYAQAYPDG